MRTLNTLTRLFPPIILRFLSLFISLHINSWPPSLPPFRTCFFCFLFIPLASAHYMTMPHMYHQYSCVFVQFILIIYIYLYTKWHTSRNGVSTFPTTDDKPVILLLDNINLYRGNKRHQRLFKTLGHKMWNFTGRSAALVWRSVPWEKCMPYKNHRVAKRKLKQIFS